MQEARDHGPEMVAAVVAPGEAGGMAFGVGRVHANEMK